jgi:two-component system phosphate regulon sensor histidine kinase PhoR
MSLAADTIMNEKVIADKDKVTYYAQQIKNENRKLNDQVEKVLDLALTEKNALEMNLANTDIIRCAENAVAALKLQAESAGGSITLTAEGAFTPIAVDRFHMERLLVNLIDNAIKYGGKPPVVKVTAQQYRGGTEIKVTDNGSGIPKEDWKSVFDPFRRLQS